LLAEPEFRTNARRLGGIIAGDVAGDVATRELEAVGLRRTRQPA
jgi:hypothetical protein